jgi:hypothetical protein
VFCATAAGGAERKLVKSSSSLVSSTGVSKPRRSVAGVAGVDDAATADGMADEF